VRDVVPGFQPHGLDGSDACPAAIGN
jgi:hypothetical protein